MNPFIGLLALSLSVLQLASCRQARVEGDVRHGALPQESVSPSPADGKDPKDKDPKPDPQSGDSISIPNPVTGASLYCRPMESDSIVALDISCYFQDEAGQRVAAARIAARQDFSYSGSIDSAITVAILPASEEYEVTYRFQGAGFDVMQSAARALSYRITFSQLVTGEAELVVEAVGAEIIEEPAARFLREASTDTNANGLCDDGEFCIFEGAGLMWYRDLGVAKSYAEAKQTCDDFTSGFDDFRLPTLAEMKMAYAKGIVEFSADESLAIINGPLWTTDVGAEANTKAVYNLHTGVTNAIPESEAVHSICVRAIP